MLTVGKAETATKNNLKVGNLTPIYMFKINRILILLSIFALISCHKKENIETENVEKENVEKVDSVSAKEIQENQVKEILFSNKIKFERIYISKDAFDNDYYRLGLDFTRDGKFDESKGIFTEIEIPENGNVKINQKFNFNSGILTLDRMKSYGYELEKDQTYNFELYLRDYGVLAIDKSIKAKIDGKYCGMLIYNTVDYEIYNTYDEVIKNDFKQLNNEK